MFEELERINERPEPFQFYTASDLWTDEHSSKQMLSFHLNEAIDVSSRNAEFINQSVEWIVTKFSIGLDSKIVDFGCGPGLYAARLAKHGTELGVADLLRERPMSVGALAKETGTHAPTLYRLMRALSAVGIFSEIDDKVFELTPLAQCLCSDAMRPLALMFLSDWHDKAWRELTYCVRTGKSGFDHAFGKGAFEWMDENPRERSILDRGQALKAIGFAKEVVEAYDFSDFDLICDVGGGQGAFLIQLASKYPHIKGVVADLPGVVDSAEKAIANADLNNRCKVISYDFLNGVPPVCDAYFLVNVLHDWEDEFCCRILKNISASMKAEYRLWIVEYLLETEPGFSVAKLLDLEVLVMGGGRERTVDEYKTLLGSVGLEVSRVIPLSNGLSLLECMAA